MADRQSVVVRLLLVVLGLSLLWTAIVIGGPETESVWQYTAHEISQENGELVLTDLQSGDERRGDQVTDVNIDDRIACFPVASFECSLFRNAYEGDVDVTGISSHFEYVYLESAFYDLGRERSDIYLEFERTTAERAFEHLAIGPDQLTDAERSVLDEGQITTTRPIPHANQLVTDDSQYYTILQTGTKVYGDGSSFCSSSGDGFCDRADRERWAQRAPQIGLGVLGLLGTVVGGYGTVKRRL